MLKFSQESDLKSSYQSSVYKVLNVPREIYQLVDYLNRNGMKTHNLFTIDRKYAASPVINDIRDWLNEWASTDFRKYSSAMRRELARINLRWLTPTIFKPWKSFKFSINFKSSTAGTPHTAAEALLMLLESPPEPLTNPLEEECLYAASFEECCDIIRILPGPKKNVFLYICMFLTELLKFREYNGLDASKLGR